MHFSVMLIHENDEGTIMGKRHYDAEEDEGAELEFQSYISVKDAKAEYKKVDKKEYPTFEKYIDQYYGYELNDEGTHYGYYSNIYGMYDYYVVGGRWSNLLPACNSASLKKEYDKTLNMKNKRGIELFRDNPEKFLEISQLPFMDGCIAMGIGGCDSIIISDKIKPEDIISRIENYCNIDYPNEKEFEEPLIKIFAHTIIQRNDEECETVQDSGLTKQEFISLYNELLKISKKSGGREFYITILDLHS